MRLRKKEKNVDTNLEHDNIVWKEMDMNNWTGMNW